MTHFGLICPTSSGHLNPMTTLGYELKNRDHHVTLVGFLDARAKTEAAGLNFLPIGESDFPLGAIAATLAELGTLRGMAAVKHTINVLARGAYVTLRDAPTVIKAAGIEALLVDQVSVAGGTIAEFLGLPFITICNALVLNQEPLIPPFNTSWQYNATWWARLRNLLGYHTVNCIAKPIGDSIAHYRQQWNLSPYFHININQYYSPLAQISQQPIELEFPREQLPPWFHFTGPYHNPASREPIPFPWEKLTGQPLIYASMGTLQNRLFVVFEQIAAACEGLDAQLVISLGGSADPSDLPPLSGNPLVVGYAPQLELLPKTTLTITHAGMNTTLESLSHGVPMVAIPVTNDQLGIASRIAWAGCGEVVALKRLNVPRLHEAIRRVLRKDSYKQNALRLQNAIDRAGGVTRAADIIERVVATRQPVLSLATQSFQ
ncbi:MAG: glycosyltransferase [Spirulina sp.]